METQDLNQEPKQEAKKNRQSRSQMRRQKRGKLGNKAGFGERKDDENMMYNIIVVVQGARGVMTLKALV